MPVTIHETIETSLSADEISQWRTIPTAIISDELDRFQAMDAGIKRIGSAGDPVAGPAVTVRTMESDNLALHRAVALAPAGKILVVEAGGGGRNAVWGGILHRAAELRGIVAVIIDGYVRDSAELAASAVPCYARGAVPAGPQKAWGGEINGLVSVGGCPVAAGDLVVADADGVVVVPRARVNGMLEGCRRRLKSEETILARLEAGETTVRIFGLPE